MSDYYILEGRTPVPATVMEWAAWFETHKQERVIAFTETPKGNISTVFLGANHGYNGEILLYETMVFGGALDEEQERYETIEEAEAGHKRWVEEVEKSEEADDSAGGDNN